MRAVLALGTGARPRVVGKLVGASERISGLLVLSAVARRAGVRGRRDCGWLWALELAWDGFGVGVDWDVDGVEVEVDVAVSEGMLIFGMRCYCGACSCMRLAPEFALMAAM